MAAWCRKLLGADASLPRLTLEQYLAGIPRMECLGQLPSGTVVLIRGDVDAKPGAKIGEGDIRLRSMADTLRYGQQRGWKQVIFGHVGREPEKSLAKVAARLGEILGCAVIFIDDWLDPATMTIKDEAAQTIAKSRPGSVIVLQNTRKYEIERVLWKAKPSDVDKLADKLAKLANEFAAKVAELAGVLRCAADIVDGAGADDDDEARVRAVEDALEGLPPLVDRVRGSLRDRQPRMNLLGRRHQVEGGDIQVFQSWRCHDRTTLSLNT
jgi:hypothetical protein